MASKAALRAAAQVLVLAGDAAAFTKEIDTMRLRPITYELLVLLYVLSLMRRTRHSRGGTSTTRSLRR